MLRTLGIGGAVLAGSAALGGRFAYADNERPGGTDAGRAVLQVANVKELLALSPDSLRNGQRVVVGGYERNGDGGGKVVRWDANSTKADNGGTVHALSGANGEKR